MCIIRQESQYVQEGKRQTAAKRREDPGQQKSKAAKPTMVKTDRKTRKEEMEINEGQRQEG